jgi:gluconate 2-dehydrogenase gamma chain
MAIMLDRREVLGRAAMLLGGALSSSVVAGVLGGCASVPSASPQKPAYFSADEMAIVTAMADQIIPKTDTPGALDVGVPAFMDKMMAGFYQDRQRQIMRAGLMSVTTDASELAGKPFAQLTPEQQVQLMKEYDRLAYDQAKRNAGVPDADPHFFRMIKELTIVGFCTSEAGATKFLKYAPIPGPYRADIPYSEVGKAWAT